jgi:uncharacterized protein (DUF169 family)
MQNTAQQLQDLLGLRKAPVAVSFRPAPPAGAPHVSAAAPSGCTYWKRAAEGETFYTEAADHYGCPIGAYTHGIDLPAEVAQQLQGLVTTMVELGYLRTEEVPNIPRRTEAFGVAVYAPLAKAEDADVVLVCGNARQMMLLSEAAHAAGATAGALMGRPTCAAIPEAMRTGQGAASLGCIGNRVYTKMTDDELYFALPARHLPALCEKLTTLVHANRELERYHSARVS